MAGPGRQMWAIHHQASPILNEICNLQSGVGRHATMPSIEASCEKIKQQVKGRATNPFLDPHAFGIPMPSIEVSSGTILAANYQMIVQSAR